MMSILFLVCFMIPMSLLVNWLWLGCLVMAVMSFFILIYLNYCFYSCVGYSLGLDGASYCMIVLTLWIFGLMVLASMVFTFTSWMMIGFCWFFFFFFLCLMFFICCYDMYMYMTTNM